MGYAVAINDSVAVVSAIGDSGNAGAAYVFQFNENQEWTYSHKIIASDAIATSINKFLPITPFQHS